MTRAALNRRSNGVATKPSFFWRCYTFFAITLVLGGGLAFLGQNLWYYLDNPVYFPVRSVVVAGDYRQLDPKKIEQIILPSLQKGFFALPVAELQATLSDLPWVDTVSLKRKWPDALLVTIQQQKPVAIWNGAQLINQRGLLFQAAASSFPPALPKLVGPSADFNEAWVMFQKILKLSSAGQLPVPTQLILTPQHDWLLQLPSMTVALGQDDVGERLQRLVSILPILKTKNPTASAIDLRYPSGIAVGVLST